MSLLDRVSEEMKAAMKAGEGRKLSVLRMLKAEFQKEQARVGRGVEIAEEALHSIVRRLIKQRKEAAEQYRAAGAEARAQEELDEVAQLAPFLPDELTDDELDAIIQNVIDEVKATSPKDVGKVMRLLMPLVGGRSDGTRVKDRVDYYLSR